MPVRESISLAGEGVRIDRTRQALRHGQTILAGGRLYRVELGLGADTDWHVIDTHTGAEVATAPNQSALRHWLHNRGRTHDAPG